MEAYLDNAATTQAFPEVCEIVQRLMMTDFGNPSSKHTKGMQAENYINEAKENIAATLKCQPKEIIFTSGGTESNNMALIGTAMANKRAGKHIITTRIEHASVHEPLAFLEELGYEITYLKVDNMGHVDEKELENLVRDDTVIVSIMFVNNEIGAVQDIAELSKVIKGKNPHTYVHVDAIQAFGKYPIYPKRMGIDMLSISSHKLHGPKGVGLLYIDEKVKIVPIIYGGGQQKGMRSGTDNVPGIAGFALAAKMTYADLDIKVERMYQLKQKLVDGLLALGDVHIHGMAVREGAPHIVSAAFVGVRSEVLLHTLEDRGIYVSAGSACSTHKRNASPTMQAIQAPKQLTEATVRFSLAETTTEEEIDYCLSVLGEVLPMLRRYTRR